MIYGKTIDYFKKDCHPKKVSSTSQAKISKSCQNFWRPTFIDCHFWQGWCIHLLIAPLLFFYPAILKQGAHWKEHMVQFLIKLHYVCFRRAPCFIWQGKRKTMVQYAVYGVNDNPFWKGSLSDNFFSMPFWPGMSERPYLNANLLLVSRPLSHMVHKVGFNKIEVVHI